MRAALVTDQPLLAEGLNSLFKERGGFQLKAVYPNPDVFLDLLPGSSAELVIVDGGPEITFRFLSAIRAAAPDCKLVLLARSVTFELSSHAREVGVQAVLPTHLATDRLLAHLRRVERGECVYEDAPDLDEIPSRSIQLTAREGQLVELVGQGLKNKEMAARLGITEGTVKVYLSKLFHKTGANDRLDLALWGLKRHNDPENLISALHRPEDSKPRLSPLVGGSRPAMLERRTPVRAALG